MKIKQTSVLTSLLLASLTLTNCGKVDEIISTAINNIIKNLQLSSQASVATVPPSVAVPVPDSLKTVPSTNKIAAKPTSQAVTSYKTKQQQGYQTPQIGFAAPGIAPARPTANVVSAAINSIDDIAAPANVGTETPADTRREQAPGLDRMAGIGNEADFVNKFVQVELTLLDPVLTDLKSTMPASGQATLDANTVVVNADATAKQSFMTKLQNQNLNIDSSELPAQYKNPALCYKNNGSGDYKYSVTFIYDDKVKGSDLCAANNTVGSTIAWNEAKTKVFASRSITTQETNPIFRGAVFNVTRSTLFNYDTTTKVETLNLTTTYKAVNPALANVESLLNETTNVQLTDCSTATEVNCVDVYAETTARDITPATLQAPATIAAIKAGTINTVAPEEQHIITGRADKDGGFIQDIVTVNGQTTLTQELFNEDALPTEVKQSNSIAPANANESLASILKRAEVTLAVPPNFIAPAIVPDALAPAIVPREVVGKTQISGASVTLPNNKYTQKFIESIKDPVNQVLNGGTTVNLPPVLFGDTDPFSIFRPATTTAPATVPDSVTTALEAAAANAIRTELVAARPDATAAQKTAAAQAIADSIAAQTTAAAAGVRPAQIAATLANAATVGAGSIGSVFANLPVLPASPTAAQVAQLNAAIAELRNVVNNAIVAAKPGATTDQRRAASTSVATAAMAGGATGAQIATALSSSSVAIIAAGQVSGALTGAQIAAALVAQEEAAKAAATSAGVTGAQIAAALVAQEEAAKAAARLLPAPPVPTVPPTFVPPTTGPIQPSFFGGFPR